MSGGTLAATLCALPNGHMQIYTERARSYLPHTKISATYLCEYQCAYRILPANVATFTLKKTPECVDLNVYTYNYPTTHCAEPKL